MDRDVEARGTALAALTTALALVEVLQDRGVLDKRGYADVIDAALQQIESAASDEEVSRFARSSLELFLRAAGPPVSEPYPEELAEPGRAAPRAGWLRRVARRFGSKWSGKSR